ncbi:MAG: glycoside hydrolase family 30 beta sandwich domain-containing protein [Bacteroidales bacterium]|nr:glycoside hydrolase family 30 beta sandwich domain-containing protein [Bacteroidales bacterium]
MKKHPSFLKQRILGVLVLLLLPATSFSHRQLSASKRLENAAYVTTADKSHLFEKIPLSFNTSKELPPSTIQNDRSKIFQEMDGFGAAMTGSSCYNLLQMNAKDRARLLKETFDPKEGIGYSFEGNLMWDMKEICLGTINNWSKAVIVWNFMLDKNHGPNRPSGCRTCYGAVDIHADYKTMTKNSHYYTISHLAKVIKPGARRIGTSGYKVPGLYYAAFLNRDHSYALVLVNDTDNATNITLSDGEHSFSYLVPARAVASYQWV